MAEAHADTILPVPPRRAFQEATDLARADWLPAVRRLRHLQGPISGVGARYQAEVDVPGHRLHGVLVCRQFQPPRRAVWALERGLDLRIVVLAQPAGPGCRLELRVSYRVGGLAGWAVERTTIGPVQRAVEQALTSLASRLQGRPGEASGAAEPDR